MITLPKVSIVIPTYNRASSVAQAVDSVLAQTYNEYEIIVVDDGSTDETREVLERYGDRIRYIYQQNSGVSSARNKGILAAMGEWVAFLDSDDEWMPTKLEKQVEIGNCNPSIVASVTNSGIVLSGEKEIDLFNIRGLQVASFGAIRVDRPLSLIMELQPFTTSSLFVRRQTLFAVGLFDDSMTLYEDYDLMCRVALGGGWAATGERLVKIFRRGDVGIALSMQQPRNDRMAVSNLTKIFLKLIAHAELTREERILVLKNLSASRFNEGVFSYQEGERHVARKLFVQSFSDHPSLRSLLRSGLPLCLGPGGLSLLKRYRSGVDQGFRRSDFDQASLDRGQRK